MGNRDVKVSKCDSVEGKLQGKNKTKGEDQRTSWAWRMARGMGVAFLTASVCSQGAEGRPLVPESSSSALALRDSDNARGLTPAFSDQGVRFIGNSQSERSVPAIPEAFSHPNGPTVQEIWPSLGKAVAEHFEEEASKGLHQGEAQRRYDGEIALDFRSRKVTLGEKTSRSATDAHPDQLKQDKSERAESSEKKETTWQDLKKMFNNEEMRESIKQLMQNETAMTLLYKATNNDTVIAAINDLAQNDAAIKGMKELMQVEGFKELAVSQLQDTAGVRRALKAVANGTLTNECYKAYKNFFSYQECCRDQKGIPRCNENFRIDWKHTGGLVGGLAGAGVLACCCAIRCVARGLSKKDNSEEAACAEACCELGYRCCCGACIALCEALSSGN